MVFHRFVINQIWPHLDTSWISGRIRVFTIKQTDVSHFVFSSSNINLIGDIYHPWHHIHSAAPAVPPVKPRTVLIRHCAFADSVSTPHGRGRVFEHSVIWMTIDDKVMRCHAEFCTAIIIAAVAADCRYKFDAFCFCRYSERMHTGVLLVVVIVFVEFSSPEELDDLVRNIVLIFALSTVLVFWNYKKGQRMVFPVNNVCSITGKNLSSCFNVSRKGFNQSYGWNSRAELNWSTFTYIQTLFRGSHYDTWRRIMRLSLY